MTFNDSLRRTALGLAATTMLVGGSLGFVAAATTAGAADGVSAPMSVSTIALHNNTAEAGTDCPAGGAAYWHFVFAPNDDSASFTSITLTFIRAAVGDLRLRSGPPAHAPPVRPRDRPAPLGRGGAGPRPGAGRRRGAAALPHPAVPRRRQALLGQPVRPRWRGGDRRGRRRPAVRRDARGRRNGRRRLAGRAMEAILRGDVEHAFHPGGGLHHAMADRASGFCIYNDPALAIARARADGLRVLYVDLDVHHGDGVQAIHWADPGVLTVSFHEIRPLPLPGHAAGWGSWARERPPGRRSTCRSSRGRGKARGWTASGRCSPSWPPRSGRT